MLFYMSQRAMLGQNILLPETSLISKKQNYLFLIRQGL